MGAKIKVKALFCTLASVGALYCGAVAVASYLNTIAPQGIIIHHSAIPFPDDRDFLDVNVIDAIHRKRGYSIFYWQRRYHIGYHYLILPNGAVMPGRPERCKGAHALGFNSYIGICLVGNFSSLYKESNNCGPDTPTNPQIEALVSLCSDLSRRHQFSITNVKLHRDVSAKTECPGDKFPAETFLSRLMHYTN